MRTLVGRIAAIDQLPLESERSRRILKSTRRLRVHRIGRQNERRVSSDACRWSADNSLIAAKFTNNVRLSHRAKKSSRHSGYSTKSSAPVAAAPNRSTFGHKAHAASILSGKWISNPKRS
jgi:hypothetical protein